jgi:ferredoxin
VADGEERQVGGLRVRIDRGLCVGFADCIEAAPEAFRLDAEGVAVFTKPETVDRGRLLAACEACPVDALTVWDETGAQVAPAPRIGAAPGPAGGEGGPTGALTSRRRRHDT